MNTGSVIVAAGLSSRMGEYKPLMDIGGVSVARRVVGAFADAGVSPVVVVTGYRANELEAHLSAFLKDRARERSLDEKSGGERGQSLAGESGGGRGQSLAGESGGGREAAKRLPDDGLLFVRNEGYASTPMYESAKIGLSYIMGRCARTFFCPVDVPLFTAGTVRRLMESGASVAKPIYKGKKGHPILIDAKLIPALIGLGRACGAGASRDGRENPPGGLKAALAGFENETEFVEVDDEGILYDADTPEDMRRLRRTQTRPR